MRRTSGPWAEWPSSSKRGHSTTGFRKSWRSPLPHRQITGHATISLDPFVISDVLITVPAPSLTTGKIALRDKHMHETLESEKFPEISFRLTSPITSDTVAALKLGDEVKVVANGV
jgi:hypothetical protein